MSKIHFLNVLDGDCTIIQHDSTHVSVIDVSNAYNSDDTLEETLVKLFKNRVVKNTNYVPTGKINYNQKQSPDNPIDYLNKLGVKSIFRFIITHPDMDHLDGISDLFTEFTISNTWDSNNNKELDLNTFPREYNKEDWKFYKALRDGQYTKTKRLTYYAGNENPYYTDDKIKILCPTPALVKQANQDGGDINDLSYVLLFTPPKKGGGVWKIIFSGDSHDDSWKYILKNYKAEVTNIDILFAPHHGRDSNRSYEFLDVLTPSVTLFGNASSEHLAYSSYPKTRITNNQAGYVVIDINEDRIIFHVKNKEFAENMTQKWHHAKAEYDKDVDAFIIGQLNP